MEEWRKNGSAFAFKLPEEAALGDSIAYGRREFRPGAVFYAKTDEDYGECLVRGGQRTAL